MSCSIGVAHFPSAAASADELKEKADKALYVAKEAGRDRAVAWKGEAPAPLEAEEQKRDIPTIAKKNRVLANIARALEERESFLILGHKDPDEDCVSSMVAFALLGGQAKQAVGHRFGARATDNFELLLEVLPLTIRSG